MLSKKARQLADIGRGYVFGGSLALCRIHAHVEGGVKAKRESTITVIELR